MTYEEQGDIDRAIESYREAVALAASPMNYLAWLYQKQGNLDDSLPLSQVAVMMKPDRAAFLDTLAVILCKRGRQEEAIPLMERAVKLNPNNDEFRNRLENFKKGRCQ